MKVCKKWIALGLLSVLPAASAETIYGLTNLQQLVTFDSITRSVTSTQSLTGFSVGGELLLSIDVRPATGQLYGLSSTNQLYVITPSTGARSAVGSPLTLTGNLKSIDFNPTVDRIRVLSSAGNNLRVNPVDGVPLTDTNLAFAGGDSNAGDTPAVVNGAYTNSFAGATTTTLYDLDAGNDALLTQNPPNNGTLNTIGSVGFDLASSSGFTGFDISGATGIAYLVGNNLTGGLTANTLYTVNLGTGAASAAGPVSGVSGSFRDIAVVPEPASLTLLGGAVGGLLIRRRRKD